MAPSPSVFLAAVAQRTKRLRFGPLVYTVNLYHPLRLIDEICMLDQMSGGRLELGIGRGISPYEVGYYGVDPATGPERFAEAMQVIMKGLTEKRLSHEGKYFTFKDVPMEMQPVQRPHPPLWYGANSLESADRLAKQACNTVVGMRADGVGQFSARYRAAWKALGRDEKDLPLIGLSRHVVVGDTDREAQSAAKRAFALWYDALIHLWRAHGVGLPRQMIPAEFEPALEGGYIIAGSAVDGARPAEARQRDRRHQLLPVPAGLRRPVVRGIDALDRAFGEGSDAGALVGIAHAERGPPGPLMSMMRTWTSALDKQEEARGPTYA